MSDEIFKKIIDLLEENKIEYKLIKHEPTFTSEESARLGEQNWNRVQKHLF